MSLLTFIGLVFFVSIGLLITTGLMLLNKGYRLKQSNLTILGWAYIFLVLNYSIMLISPIFLMGLITMWVTFCLLDIFIHLAFYNHRKSPVALFLVINSVLHLIKFFSNGLEIEPLKLIVRTTPLTTYLNIWIIIMNFGWLAWESYRSLKITMTYKIEPWILVRIRLIVAGALSIMLVTIPDFILLDYSNTFDFNIPVVAGLQVFRIIVILVSCLFVYLAWGMPAWFKIFLNRHYKKEDISQVDQWSESEIVTQLKGGVPNHE